MISDTIRKDMTEALKAREALKLETLRGILSAFTNELVAKGKTPQEEISDEDALVVLKRLSKQRREAADQFRAGNRAELAEKEEKELLIISSYLPPSLPREEVEKIAREEKESLGITDIKDQGRLIGAIMKKSGGQADSETVREVVSSLLS